MGNPATRTTSGINSSKRGAGLLVPTFVGGEVDIVGRPAIVQYNSIGQGASNLNLPPASDYNGGQIVLELTADVGNPIDVIPATGDSLVNDPGQVVGVENLVAYATQDQWHFFDLTPST